MHSLPDLALFCIFARYASRTKNQATGVWLCVTVGGKRRRGDAGMGRGGLVGVIRGIATKDFSPKILSKDASLRGISQGRIFTSSSPPCLDVLVCALPNLASQKDFGFGSKAQPVQVVRGACYTRGMRGGCAECGRGARSTRGLCAVYARSVRDRYGTDTGQKWDRYEKNVRSICATGARQEREQACPGAFQAVLFRLLPARGACITAGWRRGWFSARFRALAARRCGSHQPRGHLLGCRSSSICCPIAASKRCGWRFPDALRP